MVAIFILVEHPREFKCNCRGLRADDQEGYVCSRCNQRQHMRCRPRWGTHEEQIELCHRCATSDLQACVTAQLTSAPLTTTPMPCHCIPRLFRERTRDFHCSFCRRLQHAVCAEERHMLGKAVAFCNRCHDDADRVAITSGDLSIELNTVHIAANVLWRYAFYEVGNPNLPYRVPLSYRTYAVPDPPKPADPYWLTEMSNALGTLLRDAPLERVNRYLTPAVRAAVWSAPAVMMGICFLAKWMVYCGGYENRGRLGKLETMVFRVAADYPFEGRFW